MTKKYRRRKYFINKGFQTRFILPFLLSSLLANIIAVTIFINLARYKIDKLLFSMRMDHASAGALLTPMAFMAGTAALLSVILLVWWMTRGMNYRLTESLHQIRSDLGNIGSGNLSCRITMRERDEFHDFAEEINAMTGELQRRFNGINEQADDLFSAADVIKASPDSAPSHAVVQSVRVRIKSMRERLGAFKV